MFDDGDYLTQALESGASGYLLKDTPVPQLIAALAEVARGGSHLSPRMLTHLVQDFRSRTVGESRVSLSSTLTQRELQILKSLAEGLSVKEIACDLDLATKTVEAHLNNPRPDSSVFLRSLLPSRSLATF
jgi:DNA-binding NarL/FixJ family response regulator